MDPRKEQRSFYGDGSFWFSHQADWYESVIMSYKHVTTEMKWIDWGYLRRLASPVKEVVDAVYTHCWEMDLVDIMSFQCHWNEEVVAQFYAALYIEENERLSIGILEGRGSPTTWLISVHCLGTLDTLSSLVVALL